MMAIIYTVTLGGKEYGFDFEDQRIDIDATIATLDLGDLYTAIKEAQASEVGIAFNVIARGEGLSPLSASIKTFLTISLQDSWELNSLKTSGKFEVSGGNLIRADGADPFRDNSLITYIAYLSQAGVVAETGVSGLTAEESAKLDAVKNDTSLIPALL